MTLSKKTWLGQSKQQRNRIRRRGSYQLSSLHLKGPQKEQPVPALLGRPHANDQRIYHREQEQESDFFSFDDAGESEREVSFENAVPSPKVIKEALFQLHKMLGIHSQARVRANNHVSPLQARIYGK